MTWFGIDVFPCLTLLLLLLLQQVLVVMVVMVVMVLVEGSVWIIYSVKVVHPPNPSREEEEEVPT